MLRRSDPRRPLALVLCAATFVLGAGVLLRGRPSAHAAPHDLETIPAPTRPLPAPALDRLVEKDGRFVVPLDDHAHAELTLDPALQHLAEKALDDRGAPLGAVVMVSVSDGRVLALAGRSRDDKGKAALDLALRPWAPAASVFKVVTAAALVGKGVSPDTRVCYHGGIHGVDESNLSNHPRLDHECNSLAYGLAHSQNAILARLAHDHLDAATLDDAARALGFGAPLPLEPAPPASTVSIPAAPLDFARTAAGFWNTQLSPLHGAFLAATIAREGTTPPIHLVERVVDGDQVIAEAPAAPRRALPAEVARAVGNMMVGTTEFGTARHSFRDRRGRHTLPGISVAGKTGSLSGFESPDQSPSATSVGMPGERALSYSWFVGYAPADHPEVAFAVLLGNDHPWESRAHALARRVLGEYFDRAPSQRPKQMMAAR